MGDKGTTQVLSEESSRHIVQVLRMKEGEGLRLTDGMGKLAEATLTNDHKKKTEVVINQIVLWPQPSSGNVIAISLLKNTTRFEWFIEKAAELGIRKIIPLICTRTEKQHFRFERMKSILVSAMLQSQQPWLTELVEPVSFKDFIAQDISAHAISKHGTLANGTSTDSTSTDAISSHGISEDIKGFIAHCEATHKVSLSSPKYQTIKQKLVLIGPEGDFTSEEIKLATDIGYEPVELGKTRLRTETAGVVAATLIQLFP